MTCKDCVHYEVCKIIHFPSMFGLTGDACKHRKPKSRFVELPCEVGQTVYEIYPKIAFFMAPNVIESECEGYGISERVATLEDIARWITPSPLTGITHWGGTVFPTKEEAENALKERCEN